MRQRKVLNNIAKEYLHEKEDLKNGEHSKAVFWLTLNTLLKIGLLAVTPASTLYTVICTVVWSYERQESARIGFSCWVT